MRSPELFLEFLTPATIVDPVDFHTKTARNSSNHILWSKILKILCLLILSRSTGVIGLSVCHMNWAEIPLHSTLFYQRKFYSRISYKWAVSTITRSRDVYNCLIIYVWIRKHLLPPFPEIKLFALLRFPFIKMIFFLIDNILSATHHQQYFQTYKPIWKKSTRKRTMHFSFTLKESPKCGAYVKSGRS